MKRGICIAVSALLLAAPVQAQARVSGYEVREVPHTFTVKMGADGLTKDGEAVTLPEGAEPYQKDGVLMVAAEPFLKALAEDVSLVWHKFDEEVLYVFWGNYLITFDAAQKELYSGRIHSLIVPDMERRGTQLFLPLRDWADLLPEFYCEAQGISWDAKTRTATLQYMAAELETKGELPTPQERARHRNISFSQRRSIRASKTLVAAIFPHFQASLSAKHLFWTAQGRYSNPMNGDLTYSIQERGSLRLQSMAHEKKAVISQTKTAEKFLKQTVTMLSGFPKDFPAHRQAPGRASSIPKGKWLSPQNISMQRIFPKGSRQSVCWIQQ